MNRKTLVAGVFLTAAIGIGFAVVPFMGSLRLNEKAHASLPAIDVSSLQPGQTAVRDNPLNGYFSRNYRSSILFHRRANGTLSAWNVVTIDGKIAMPDIHWWRPYYACENFHLAAASGSEAQNWKCEYSNIEFGESWKRQWHWSQDGKNLGDWGVDDMEPTVGMLDGHYFVVGKRK